MTESGPDLRPLYKSLGFSQPTGQAGSIRLIQKIFLVIETIIQKLNSEPEPNNPDASSAASAPKSKLARRAARRQVN